MKRMVFLSAALCMAAFALFPAAEIPHIELTEAYPLAAQTDDHLPQQTVSYAECVVSVARVTAANGRKSIRTVSGVPWYTPFVDYAVSNGLLSQRPKDADMDRPVTRSELACLLYAALPADSYPAVNDISRIPDVSASRKDHEAIMTLYRAGVLVGEDEYGTFRSDAYVTRAELNAALTRAALPDRRVRKTFMKYTAPRDEAYLLTQTSTFSGGNTGIRTGWFLDARGGVPRTGVSIPGGTLTGMGTADPTWFIREFDPISTGVITTYATLRLDDILDGFCIEHRNEDGRVVWHIEVKDGFFAYRDTDGSLIPFTKASAAQYETAMVLDIENGTCDVYLNGAFAAQTPLLVGPADCRIVDQRYGLLPYSMATATLLNVFSTVNYSVFDNFSYRTVGRQLANAAVSGNELRVNAGGSASYDFTPIDGKVVSEATVLVNDAVQLGMTLSGEGGVIAEVGTFGGEFIVNGETLYTCRNGLWYRIRLECDMDTQTVLVKLNGREVGSLPFASPVSSADGFVLRNDGSVQLRADDLKVFATYTDQFEDYVPEPVIPRGSDNYYVGMNICSLWQEGSHYGWACITPYEDLVLGYYDEGIPETADWEIKYMVEHGVDFQAFCWYADESATYLKAPRLSAQLHDGYMNARYSDYMHYCLIWECANAARPKTLDDFKNYYVPYFIENYFLDPRYMTIDNRIVFCMFSPNSLLKSDSLGTEALVHEALDYMENEVIKLGFDGIIYMGCNSPKSVVTSLGLDASYAYNWGTSGYLFSTNKGSNISLAAGNDSTFYTVPTISVGFNSIGWHGVRYPMMSVEDFRRSHLWVRDEYMPTYATKNTWREKLVMLSTWNEYGEGTYIMPGRCNGGFGYLDVIRDIYTDETVDERINTVPTEAQLRRICRMYPSYRKVLRDTGYSEMKTETLDDYDMCYTYDLTKMSGLSNNGFTDFAVDGSGAHGKSRINDSMFWLPRPSSPVDLAEVDAVCVRMAVPAGERIEVFYVTDEQPSWVQDQSVQLTSTTDEMTDYVVRVSRSWTGNLQQLRVDPTANTGISFTVESVSLLSEKPSLITKTKMTVNEMDFIIKAPSAAYDGETYIAYDLSTALDYRLAAYTDWRFKTGVLSITANGHTAVFTVGSRYYTADGITRTLPHEVYLEDGLPMIPVKALCGSLGFTCTVEGNHVGIRTHQYDYFTSIAAIPKGCFEFNNIGFTEGWGSSMMNLHVGKEGYMTLTCTSSNDPTSNYTLPSPMVAADYKTLTIRCRWSMENRTSDVAAMYFITDRDSTWNEAKNIRLSLPRQSSGGEFVVLTAKLANYKTWTDNITALRFDPFNAHGVMDIDYIRFE